ncbi:hypothetical protein [Cellulomonas sp. C5510]|uniref:hypothetical protein n=1 Tax=Cellulomonas sp. C5510 TaxID=2871170 RepID=UPI001C98B367|nr:hypothetical protein [Cellulomonas sp. C5510]QZN85810.1 hypothetical protein K5O09_00825 [Cellulomonas sp. C5510]
MPVARRRRPPTPVRAALTAALVLAAGLLTAGPAAAVPYAVTGAPTLPGNAWLGQPLTVSLAGVTVNPAPVTTAVDWYWSDGTQLADDRTDLEYVPTEADLGKSLYAAVWFGDGTSETHVVGTNMTGAVATPGFDATPSYAVTGTGLVGQPLTLTPTGAWSPAAETLTYVWHRYPVDAVVASGTGSTFATYTPDADDVGSTLYVVVTATATGRVTNTQTSTASTTVHLGSFDGVGRPTVSGTGLVGDPFTASFDTTGVTPAPDSVGYQWYRTDGTAVPGATSATFTPGVDLLGEPLYVQAVLRAAGHHDYRTLGSDYTRTVSLRSFTPGAAPQLVGRHVLTGSLTATLDTAAWSPQPESLTYQWFTSDGTPVAGATGATLLPTRDLVGESVYVVVTAHATGYQPYVIASAPSGRIAAPTIAASSGSASVGDSVTVEVWGLLPDTEYTLELHSTPVYLATARTSGEGVLRATVDLPAGTPAGDHRIVVLLDGVAVASVPVAVVAPESPAATAPTVTRPAALATTGADDAGGLLALAVLALVAGVAAVTGRQVAARRTPAVARVTPTRR